MQTIFSTIKQGRRLKKDDQIKGKLPFVMAGTSNTGVVGTIGNDVEEFPQHSLTIDIFGNTFYRSYKYGAGDDTGVFWNEHLTDRHALLYIQTVISKQLIGKYDFGHKLRASQTHDFEFYLPSKTQKSRFEDLNTNFMSDFIRVIEKLVIKDLIEWTDKRIEVTKEVVNND